MRNKIFIFSAFLCVFTGFLANTNSLTLFFDTESIWGSGFGKALTDLGNQARTAIAPGLAAGFVILIMNGRLATDSPVSRAISPRWGVTIIFSV